MAQVDNSIGSKNQRPCFHGLIGLTSSRVKNLHSTTEDFFLHLTTLKLRTSCQSHSYHLQYFWLLSHPFQLKSRHQQDLKTLNGRKNMNHFVLLETCIM